MMMTWHNGAGSHAGNSERAMPDTDNLELSDARTIEFQSHTPFLHPKGGNQHLANPGKATTAIVDLTEVHST
jgi:hypothetical protein